MHSHIGAKSAMLSATIFTSELVTDTNKTRISLKNYVSVKVGLYSVVLKYTYINIFNI